jgi:phosphonate transport system permease protein
MNGSNFVAAEWRPPAIIASRPLRWSIGIAVALYLAAAAGSIDVNWARVAEGVERGGSFFIAFTRPDFTSHGGDILSGLYESLTMSFAATIIGVLISIPVGLGAARNIAIKPVYYFCRTIIAVARSLQEIILAIIFVAMFGFGPFAGLVTLSFATVGFFGKLLAEDIEAMDPAQAEGIKATGASWLQWINYGVQPQVMPRVIGLSLYRLDINFRESAVIGIVGGGGIGATLNTAFDRYEFDTAAAILIIIIAIVMIAEYASGIIRQKVK